MCAQVVTRHVADNTVAPAREALILMEARGKTVTLPSAYRNAGLPITIKNTPAGSQTMIVAAEQQRIDGALAYTLGPALACVRLVSDGLGWWVTAHHAAGSAAGPQLTERSDP